VGLSHSHFRQLFKDIETLKQLKEASKSKYWLLNLFVKSVLLNNLV
jgi:hypothetical protein